MVELEMAPVIASAIGFVLTLAAEALHGVRARRVLRLAFGPLERPAAWVRAVPLLRAASVAALAWGLGFLLLAEPVTYEGEDAPVRRDGDHRHVLIVLDVSPSMRLVDAGPEGDESRMERARELMESLFDRVPLDQFRVTVVAVYNGAKPVVQETADLEVVRNILGDLPMHFAFPSGKTKLFDGLEEAARIARPWNPRSTTLVVVSDGDTVPATGMPTMPASVGSTLVVGVGDPHSGTFIDGRQSRQEVSTLRQIATRLKGHFHNGNEKHLGSTLIGDLTQVGARGGLEKLSMREYALICCAAGASLLALLPLLLHWMGTLWRPGVLAGRA